MDILLNRVTAQAVNYAIRSGVTITATYAIKQCGRLLKEAPRSKDREELMLLQLRLESKIRIISPAIDMIELISARGNTSLESAVSLTKDIRYEIQKLGTRLSNAANEEELLRRKSTRAKSREESEWELKAIISAIKALLVRIEDAVPLISLAITTSGVTLSTKLSGTISPSRLLQASTFLTAADSKYTAEPGSRQQVGPTYTISLYMLFAGHAGRMANEQGIRGTTWKEVIHKARVKLMRVPLDQLYNLPGEASPNHGCPADMLPGDAKAAEFAYQLVIVEDLDDDRVHTFEENEPQPGPFDGVPNAGIRDILPVHEVSKIFYADTGKILNIGGDSDVNSPVLLLRRDVHARPPRRMMHKSEMEHRDYFDSPAANGGYETDDMQSELHAQFERESAPNTPVKETRPATSSAWRLPADLDPEWMALEVFSEETDSDSDAEDELGSRQPTGSRETSLEPSLTGALSKLNLRSSRTSNSTAANGHVLPSQHPTRHPTTQRAWPPIKTSLSLLEMLMKLTAIQQFRQESHLAIEDELLNFFLEDSATAGGGFDKGQRQRIRHDALKRVGFDPYDESPIKRRGEEYIAHARGAASPRPEFDPEVLPYDDAYGYEDAYHQSIEPGPSSYPPYSREATPSSPSPRPLMLQQTPSRTSTPGTPGSGVSEKHRSAVQAKYSQASSGGGRPASPQGQSQSHNLATPPSSTRSRQAFLRAQSEPGAKAGSPLAREFVRARDGSRERERHGDELIGTSPASEELDEAYEK
ncbi:hypothetical protein LTR36_009973 [Oleoguttula mirabilis]|uniref:Ran-binding-domain-containing protein n=1 Tax=Oleoguttula mirabilis TaxID=1507867 RepID=A0AAV9J5B9_9PEZI|nr:hypothetical protein LTR36_009973 [Oleoguttula mirabilis]